MLSRVKLTNAHTVRGRPALKNNTECFRNGLVRELKENQRKLSRHSMTELRSFRLRSVRLRLESIRLRLICQFAYVLKHVLQQLIHLLYVRSRSDPSQSIQFLERDLYTSCSVLQSHVS